MAEHARALRAVLKALTARFSSCSREELSAVLGDVDLFATASSGELILPPSPENLKLAAAFVLLSQIIVYAVLATRTTKLASIGLAEAHSWSELHEKHFQQLRGTTYDCLFALPVATLLAQDSDFQLLGSTVSAVRNVLPLLPEHDVLGKIFHALVPHGLRKRIGVFYTNDAAAHLLANLAIHTANARVIDPACGSGALLLAAYSRLATLCEANHGKEPRRMHPLNQLTGIDVMPFATYLAAVNLLLHEPKAKGRSLRLGVADGTQLQPDSVVINWEGKARFVVGHHDVVLMNPPFTRGHALPSQGKAALHAGFPSLRMRLGGLAGLQAYFVLVAHALLRDGGRLGAVLPASTFGTRSHQDLSSFLLGHFAIDLVILCRQRSAFSEQTNLRELLIVAQKQKPSAAQQVTFAVINKNPAFWNAADVDRFQLALSEAATGSTSSARSMDLWVRRIAQAKLSQQSRLFYQNLLQTNADLLAAYQMLQRLADRAALQPFPVVFRHLDVPHLINPRGSFALGFKALNVLPNAEACLKTNDTWLIAERQSETIRVKNRVTGRVVDLSVSDTIPCARRLAGLTTINSSDAIGRTLPRTGTPAAERLLTETFEPAAAARYSRVLNASWESRVARTRTHLMMTYKADLGAPGTHLLAAVFDDAAYPAGDAWVFPGLPADEARILALWMNSSFFLVDLLVNRNEQRGCWMRFDKPVVEQLLLLDPTAVSKTKRQLLHDLYARVQYDRLPSLTSQLAQSSRRVIDEGILQILGLKDDRARALAAKCASAARESLSDLAAMMRGD